MRMRIGALSFCGLGVLLAIHWMGSVAMAAVTVATPEIDGSSVAAGLGLLAAGILVLRARRDR